MTAQLPADLCLSFVNASWREKRNTHYDEDITESGHIIRSKKPGTPLTPIQGTIRVDAGLKMAWDAFYKSTCADGSLPFEGPDPKTKSLKVFWWVDAIEWTESGKSYLGQVALARE
jgi:hypothetical protein